MECHLTGRIVARVRLSLHLLGPARVVEGGRGSFLILELLRAGLSRQEQEQLGLETICQEIGGIGRDRRDQEEQFESWRSSLAQLGIPFSDLVKVFAAVLLLGSLEHLEQQVVEKVAGLLGLQEKLLVVGLSSRSEMVAGEMVTRTSRWVPTRDSLASSLYLRTVLMVVRRISCPGPGSGPSTGPTISLLDMVSLQGGEGPAGLETLGRNLLCETIQHFYNSHVLASVARLEVEDSADCVDLIASLDCGLLPLLDRVVGRHSSSTQVYLEQVHQWQGHHPRLGLCGDRPLDFTIRHCGGLQVVYTTTDFIVSNRASLSAEIVRMFHPSNCTSGFVSHLYSSETKHLSSSCNPASYPLTPGPLGSAPSSAKRLHQQVDQLLRRLMASSPSFLLCVSPCLAGEWGWDADHVVGQVRGLRLLETGLVMGEGLVHRARLGQFWGLFHGLATEVEGGLEKRCRALLVMLRVADTEAQVGTRHVLYSEGVRRRLESLILERRGAAACSIQAWWRRCTDMTGLRHAAIALGLNLVSPSPCPSTLP